MRPRERAIRDQLVMIGDICREAGVACLMNGDVENREQALELIKEYNVDGAMIATAAEKNSSVFRPQAEGGKAHWKEVVRHYVESAMSVDNRWGNTKFLLAQLIPGKEDKHIGLAGCKSHEQMVTALGHTELLDLAKETDERLFINCPELGKVPKRAAAKEHVRTQSKKAKMEEARPKEQGNRVKLEEVCAEAESTIAPAAIAV